jgi:DHA1 family bicyclomycin/chloramphenicol resistance-like MFS transporter
MATMFLPQIIVGFGNDFLLPTSVADAVSIRRQVAGTASGVTGFRRMAIAAAAAQGAGDLVAHASGPIPMMVQMLFFGVATAVAFLLLVRRY